MMKQLIFEFKKGRTKTPEEPRSGRPIEVTTAEIIEKIHRELGVV